MTNDYSPVLRTARREALEAGRILRLLKLPIGGGHRFGPMLSLYADLMNPEAAADERSHAACLHVADLVEAHIIILRTTAGDHPPRGRYEDPYGLEYQHGEHGALLEICARHLDAAAQAFSAAGVSPCSPYRVTIG